MDFKTLQETTMQNCSSNLASLKKEVEGKMRAAAMKGDNSIVLKDSIEKGLLIIEKDGSFQFRELKYKLLMEEYKELGFKFVINQTGGLLSPNLIIRIYW